MRLLIAIVLVTSFGGCSPEEPASSCGDPNSKMHFVVTTMGYVRSSDGISEGFDLDGTDEALCGISDLEDQDGQTGIDNGLSYLIPALDASEAKVVEGYINTGILEGRILLVVTLSHVDDMRNDDCIDVSFSLGDGEPLLGTDGGILAGQTLGVADIPGSTVTGVAIVEGRVDARPLSLDIPVSILDANFELNMKNGGLRLNLSEDGGATGFFTGTVHQDEILEILTSSGGIDSDVYDLVTSILGLALDFEDEEGQCSEMSAALSYTAANIYLVE